MPDRSTVRARGTLPEPDADAVERGAQALTMFVFPGVVVPRREMAAAVLRAVMHEDDPRLGIAKTTVRTQALRDDDEDGNCGCRLRCADLPEGEDDPAAICRGLPL